MNNGAAPMAAEEDTGDAMEVEGDDGCTVLVSGSGQGRILYSEHGQRNPGAAKAAKKRAQKAKARTEHKKLPA